MDRYKQFVAPIYGHLMSHTKIFSKTIEEQANFKEKVVEILSNTTDTILKELLWDTNWRCSLVGSWLIFLKVKTEFTNDIGKVLLQGKAGAIAYCYTLAKFRTNECSVYLTNYLDKELHFDKFPKEKFQDVALYALIYIDKKNDTNYSRQFLDANGLWTKFIEFDFGGGFKLSDYPKWGNLDKNYEEFVCMIDFMNSITTET